MQRIWDPNSDDSFVIFSLKLSSHNNPGGNYSSLYSALRYRIQFSNMNADHSLVPRPHFVEAAVGWVRHYADPDHGEESDKPIQMRGIAPAHFTTMQPAGVVLL